MSLLVQQLLNFDSQKQATGLIGRSVFQLKQQGFVTTTWKSKKYLKPVLLKSHKIKNYQLINGHELKLCTKKGILEKELKQIRCELEAYQEFLAKNTEKKLKIIQLKQNSAEKLNQLCSKFRDINPMLFL